MKIVIDGRMYGPKGSKGLGRYIQQIVEGLKIQDQKNEYVVLLTKDNWEEMAETANFKKALAPWRWYTLAEQVRLPRLLRELKPDLVHFPHFNVPIFYRGRFVLTIHDLLLRYHPSRRASTLGPIKYWFKNLGYRLVVRSAVKRAERIIAVSEFTKKEILKFYRLNPEKVKVVYEGLTKLGQNNEKNDDKEALLRYNITKPFILYVGNAYPHKNLEFLLWSFKVLAEKWPGQLVLAGKKDYFYNRLENYSRELNLGDRCLFLGYIPDEDLAALYRSAEVYIFPSLYEGFGLPPLEAMSWGLPVLNSDIPCLREVCGEASEYFDPAAEASLVGKVRLLLNNQERREELRRFGFKQVEKYRWEEAVEKHQQIFTEV